jgi:mRNA-degrading endonuclease toxin of MazEF toxin-antitoxin module
MVRLDPPLGEVGQREGHEQKGERPFLVLSDDNFNKSSGVLVGVPITSVKKPQFGAFRPEIAAGEGGLGVTSWAQTDQILTLSAARLISRKGRVGARIIAEVLDRLKVLLHIFP